jgi:hypothetical protein
MICVPQGEGEEQEEGEGRDADEGSAGPHVLLLVASMRVFQSFW